MTQFLPVRLLRSFFALLIGLSFSQLALAQDPEFTQFYAAPIYTNPAMAGTGECGGRVVLNYRNQWPSLPGTFRTFAGSFDQHIDNLGGGIGIMAVRDVAGDGLLTTTAFSGIYSYQINVNKKFTIRAGLQATYMQRQIDFNKLRFSDQIVERRGFILPTQEQLPNNQVSYPNFSTGFVGYTKNFFVGLAAHNITEPNQSFFNNTEDGTTLPRRFTLHGGVVLPLSKTRRGQTPDMTLSPNLLVMYQQRFLQINFGFYVNKGPLVTGLWFRQTAPNADALMLLLGVRYNKFKFGYSYDITVSSARPAAPGSHEISTSIEWCSKKPNKRYRKLTCPDF